MDINLIQNLKNQAISSILQAKSKDELENLRIAYLGRSGRVSELTKQIPNLNPEQKSEFGKVLNDAKKAIEDVLQNRVSNIQYPISGQEKIVDLTEPGTPIKIGHLHPTSIVINEMFEIFKHLGFSFMEDREIENDEFNFEKLNLPKDHPARSLQDALYIEDPEIVLRTHTSSIESRILSTCKPPFRIVAAGKCYRYENVNASNNAMFYQFQGVALQKGLTMADLKGTLLYFVKEFFGQERKVRFRCKYYPEVEPGGGLDLDCPFCKGKGCSVCKGRGWLEMLGCGMIHPNILKNCGHNPKEITGFAFGMGLDRLVMDRFEINDIRSLYNGDISYQII
ncbi:phenylalanine--tRNA ligase subunit alpha [Candidatus Shapirobacteria bacterium CG08_land_8_20_14_0_20_39_18]|uniref:Phenylalanine--tRNA ligase alpha subunit n=1 Tax=Candidatus Shapirobacteria bacterium CG08_land_8_20_14_0_20_39_18 TaxID=1974883 RepID=A0A2M6XD44_9BACT|nr:MAG: phenylalanine--tRNA ligase subunit alpha [Candidatus Shapirobacteria bacterium CG08_land_8_20_14_0_20_39_18]PIY66137.1 MAG: phenylalanine--tRNA ligase subunit alpha [Candidatus Shapirobacteria bacterium CG_4_10_14_0_8_um_filter_39_15]PJE68838.1 MAG: phenylalanine--tRNA ligase subunit alpha [Candidatus Shapirobacteria bacterium CG10_big_fil_rev_8_21_14_0_10_38_8]